MFTVTKQWLDQHKTPSGAYTSGQLAVFGIVAWPPPKGWKVMVIGSQISYPQKHAFERGKSAEKKAGGLKTCLQLIKKLNNTDLEQLSDACKATIEHRASGQTK